MGVCGHPHPVSDRQEISLELPRPCRDRRARSAGPRRRRTMTFRAPTLALLCSLSANAAFAQQSDTPSARRITLAEAVDLALARNHGVRLAQLSVDETDRAKDAARGSYFPQVRNDTILVHLTDTQLVAIPAGGLGVVGATPVPTQTLILNQGGASAATNGTGIVQPLTQLFRVKAANEV